VPLARRKEGVVVTDEYERAAAAIIDAMPIEHYDNRAEWLQYRAMIAEKLSAAFEQGREEGKLEALRDGEVQDDRLDCGCRLYGCICYTRE
jgi:hypothetical protein